MKYEVEVVGSFRTYVEIEADEPRKAMEKAKDLKDINLRPGDYVVEGYICTPPSEESNA